MDTDLGVSVIDRYTYHMLEFMENVTPIGTYANSKRNATLQDLFNTFDSNKLLSHAGVREAIPSEECIKRVNGKCKTVSLDTARVVDFFGGVRTAAHVPNAPKLSIKPSTVRPVVKITEQVQPTFKSSMMLVTLRSNEVYSVIHVACISAFIGIFWFLNKWVWTTQVQDELFIAQQPLRNFLVYIENILLTYSFLEYALGTVFVQSKKWNPLKRLFQPSWELRGCSCPATMFFEIE